MKWIPGKQTIAWFIKESKEGNVDLRPPFQRKPVWEDDEASYLIDTILSGLPFPEVYMTTAVTSEGNTHCEVVDGQQRIAAILRFERDDLILESEDDEIDVRWEGKSFSALGPQMRANFYQYVVCTRELSDADDTALRNMFRRLNVNQKTLNDQELRHARFKGAFIQLMEQLADDPWWTDHRIVTPREVRRQLDVELVSELMAGLMTGPLDKKDRLDEDFYAEYETQFPEGAHWQSEFLKVRDIVGLTLPEADFRRWSGRSDFYGLFLAFALLVDEGLAFNAKQRVAVAKALAAFRLKVDQAKKKTNTKRFGRQVRDYVDAITRAATDASRRELRIDTLAKIMRKAAA